MPFCTVCGNRNPDGANFCSQCGNRLGTSAPAQTGAPESGLGDETATIAVGTSAPSLADKAETAEGQLNPVDAAAVDALPTGHALLVVQRGPGSGSRFLLDEDVVRAGRHPESEIFLDDVTVSRHHAEFTREAASFTVADAGSLNGTYVNRDRIDRVVLTDGDEVQIGKYRLVFFSGHEEGVSTSGSSAAGAGHPAPSRMTIGAVLDLLRPEFPGITIPKIRFLEDKGLIKPERTAAGYRKFSDGDVERLRFVLTMQRDHYRPLKVIAEHLDALDRGVEPPAVADPVPTVPRVATRDGFPSPESFRRHDDVRISRRELVKLAGVDDALLDELEGFGLIVPGPGTRGYDGDDLLILSTARELADYGLEPRHLRAFKAAADREIGLVDQVVAPHRRATDPAAAARAEETAAELASLAVRLHATLVKAGLTRR